MTSASTDGLDLTALLGDEPFVRGLARSLLFDEHQVDDVVQQTWLEALRAKRITRGWLGAVVRSRASNVRRASARAERRERVAARGEAVPSASELLEREEQRRRIVAAVACLPEIYREVVLLRYFEGQSPARIAASLGQGVATIATRQKRALAMLRERLDAESDGDRQRWSLALIPLALPTIASRSTVAALVTNVLGKLGALLVMKYVWIGIVGILVAWLGASFWSHERDPGVDAVPSPAVATTDSIEAPTPSDGSDRIVDAGIERTAVPSAPVVREVRGDTFASVEAALAQVRGRLVEPDGRPAAQQIVRLIGVDPVRTFGSVFDPRRLGQGVVDAGQQVYTATTDDDGVFTVRRVRPDASYALHAAVDGDNPTWMLCAQTFAPAETHDLGTIVLVQKGEVAGRVVDEDGEPIAAAEVWAADLPSALLDLARVDSLRMDGALFLAVPRVTFTGGGVATPDEVADYHFVLRKKFAQRVPALDADSELMMLDLPQWLGSLYDELPVARTQSDADGHFVLRGVHPGANSLVVRAPGYASGSAKRVVVDAGARRELGDVTLDFGEMLAGLVVDDAGTPIGGASLRVASQPGFGLTGMLFAGPAFETRADGTFSLEGLPRERVFVAVQRARGGAWNVHGPFESGDEDVEIALPAARSVTLQLRDADDAPVQGAAQVVVRRGPPLGELAVAGLQTELSPKVTHDAATATLVIEGLEAGLHTLQVDVDGYELALQVVEIGAADVDATLRLSTAVTTSLVVVDSAGAPVAGAEVFAQREGWAWSRSLLFGYGAVQPWERLARFVGFTDAAGRLAVDEFAAGPLRLSARHPGHGAAEVELGAIPAPERGGEVRLVLQGIGKVVGRVFDHGVPASPERHRLVARSDDPERGIPNPAVQAVLDANGHFTMALPAGRWRVEVEESWRGAHSLGALLDRVEIGAVWFFEVPNAELEVVAGQTAELVFDLDPTRTVPGFGGRIQVRATVDGEPAVGYRLAVSGDDGDELLRCDEAGTGTSEEIIAKRHEVFLLPPVGQPSGEPSPMGGVDGFALPMWRGEVSLRIGETHSLAIALQTGRVVGTARDSAGNSLRDHYVSLDARDAAGNDLRISAELVTDAFGRYRARLPVGRYRVSIEGPAGSCTHEDVVVGAGSVTTLDSVVQSAGTLSGHVVLPADGVPAVVLLSVTWDDDQQQRLARVDPETGAFHLVGVPSGTCKIRVLDKSLRSWLTIPAEIEMTSAGLLGQRFEVGARVGAR